MKNLSEEKSLFEHHSFLVEKGHDIIRLDKFLMLRLANKSRNRIQQCIVNGNVYCNNKKEDKSSYKVKPNDKISIRFEYEPIDKNIIPENIPLDIVYDDNEIIIVNKKPGMVVHPSFGHYSGTLVHALLYKYSELNNLENQERPGLVHRIDKNTSGLLVIAKNSDTLTHLSNQFSDHSIERKYIALVWGVLKDDHGTINGNIGRNKKNRKIMDVFEDEEIGKHSVTHYKVLERFAYVTMIECQLETGRTHQIRVHMKYIGHPLFNDNEYGGDKILKGTRFSKYTQFIKNCFKLLPRQALHAKSLGFIHPKSGKKVYFDSELPDDFKNLIQKWRVYSNSNLFTD